RRAANRGHGRVGSGKIDAHRKAERWRRENREAVEGAVIAGGREQALALQRGDDEKLMCRLCKGDELAGERIGNTGELAIEPLPYAPTGRYRICLIALDRGSEGVQVSLLGVGRLIDDDICARGDAAGLLNIERGLSGSGCIARRPRSTIDVDHGEPIRID